MGDFDKIYSDYFHQNENKMSINVVYKWVNNFAL